MDVETSELFVETLIKVFSLHRLVTKFVLDINETQKRYRNEIAFWIQEEKETNCLTRTKICPLRPPHNFIYENLWTYASVIRLIFKETD